ncbi:MAG: class I SAM-dependent methyltransferase [Actinomycetota bacterium]|nr:class I SAM-dependent methyltransferase [Actinomycetota bacterium]
MTDAGLPRDYFEMLYRRKDDPWSFATRWYEERKRALTVAALPRKRYLSVLELGCSTGLITEQLAERSDAVVAIDISQGAVDIARERLGDPTNVHLQRADLRDGLPAGSFELILVSEVAYYLSRSEVDALADGIRDRLAPSADVVLCHWRWPVDDYPLSGDQAHAILREGLELERISLLEERDLLLEVLSTDGRSVATREGLR